MQTWHLHISGQVQGVGFRPFVYNLARSRGLKGNVNNTVDGVHVIFNAGRETAEVFARDLIDRAPVLSRITGYHMEMTGRRDFDSFGIIQSDGNGEASLLLTPDFGLCDDCRADIHSQSDRRYEYAFTTCTNCGPRYSIVRSLPYDRHTTTMDPFKMCAGCEAEYNDPENRRYYSQTNSCPACAVLLQWHERDEENDGYGAVPGVEQEGIPNVVAEAWKAGKIIAIKGVGGYLLTCDAANANAVNELRRRKHRPAKPFALMYPSVEILSRDAVLSVEEKRELVGIPAPIVLLEARPGAKIAEDLIAPGLHRIGAMLPYTPLYDILLEKFGHPVVATSGNITNSPIVFRDDKALSDLQGIADAVLSNNREIAVPQDDSVIRFSPRHGKRIILRRSRGLAPTYINAGLELPDIPVFAAGALLKSTFTYLVRGNCYISQYLGDTDSFDTQETYRHMKDHFLRMFNESPRVVLMDKHPNYFATASALQFARENQLPFRQYQHHQAHFAAVLGEHRLLRSEKPVLGVIWDGTGYGDDKQVLGGEFFLFRDAAFERCGHLGYFPSIAGDKMALEPRISLAAAGSGSETLSRKAQEKFSATEWGIYSTILSRKAPLNTSSIGRLFDAAASLLDLCDRSEYEGEAAGYLESLASGSYGTDEPDGYDILPGDGGILPVIPLLEAILNDVGSGTLRSVAALRFHITLADWIGIMADRTGVERLAFSGGVFQNALLVDLVIDRLSNRYELYFHDQLSPNDESISFGQLMCYCLEEFRQEHNGSSSSQSD